MSSGENNMESVTQQMVKVSQELVSNGLNKGMSGNVSVRGEKGFLITPSAVLPEHMSIASMVNMQFDGSVETNKKPSSEWRFHRDILQSRPEINAVIHTHSMFATTMACLHQDIPAFHYMIAMMGGDSIRCAPYALFGSQALSDSALDALKDRKACLLAHHGMIAVGASLAEALAIAIEVENLCEQYWRLLQITPEPPLLSEEQMQEVFQQFKGYRH
jgi:ribulose-5-phosphate 4-epimerase/fuculose-1-phosphate aldolase